MPPRKIDQLFSPWRIEWIKLDEQNPDVDGCVFCALPERESDADHLIVARSEHSFVMLNNYPYNPGHVMVIPHTHTASYQELSDAALVDHARLQAKTFEAVSEAFEPDGFNAGMNIGSGSGGSIREHIHSHIVPRWEGDTNFMPVVAETKVIVEAVDESYVALHAAFGGLDGTTVLGEDQAIRVDFAGE